MRQLAGVPVGAIVAGTGHGVLSRRSGPPGGRQLPYVESEWVPPLVVDERHCQWVEGDAQCHSWPRKKDNPQRYCAGHLRKLNARGLELAADEELRTGPH